ncbi:MAG: hypothetical protein RIR00_961 [Pseudomonadota bacterium]|jgi:nicotinate-nucleotide adenylyltransferase
MTESGPLGLFGGTFDPIHHGHLRLAEEALGRLGLAGIRWIPAGQPPHRAAPGVTGQDRLEMVRLAIAGHPQFSLDPAEVDAAAPSYTHTTLTRLRHELGPVQPLVLLLGADAFAGLASWHRWQEMLDLAHLAVAHRPGYPIAAAALPAALAAEYHARHGEGPAALAGAPAGRILSFPMTQLAISATQIRQLLAERASPRYLLPEAVLHYIQNHHLYR